MRHNWLLYMAAFFAAFAFSLFLTPYSKTIALKLNAIDYPKKRGMHKDPVPRLGGVAIFFGFFGALLAVAAFVPEVRAKEFIGFILGAFIVFALGVADDVKNLKPGTKLAVQIIAALVVIFSGTKIEVVYWPWLTNFGALSFPVTLIWIVGITNAVNLIDGLDGLAAGVSSIGAFCLMILCILTGHELAVILTACLAGSCLGFLPRNFNPAEIIMGDSGSTFLGYVLAVSSIIGVYKAYAILSVALATLALALPILDTLFAMLRRAISRKPVMEGDRGHLHHRLVDSGWTQKESVIIIYGISFTCAAIAISIAMNNAAAGIASLIAALILGFMLLIYKKRTVR